MRMITCVFFLQVSGLTGMSMHCLWKSLILVITVYLQPYVDAAENELIRIVISYRLETEILNQRLDEQYFFGIS